MKQYHDFDKVLENATPGMAVYVTKKGYYSREYQYRYEDKRRHLLGFVSLAWHPKHGTSKVLVVYGHLGVSKVIK